MILFLDFDGVMHPSPCQVDRYFCHQQLLEDWLRSRPGIDVVISSSWREINSLDEMTSFFAQDIQPRILGATPILKRADWVQFYGELPPTRFERETEVLRWLAASAEPWRAWAALDDQPWLFMPFQPRLVVCDPQVGLTSAQLQQLDELVG